jgi:hypothetical protein
MPPPDHVRLGRVLAVIFGVVMLGFLAMIPFALFEDIDGGYRPLRVSNLS